MEVHDSDVLYSPKNRFHRFGSHFSLNRKFSFTFYALTSRLLTVLKLRLSLVSVNFRSISNSINMETFQTNLSPSNSTATFVHWPWVCVYEGIFSPFLIHCAHVPMVSGPMSLLCSHEIILNRSKIPPKMLSKNLKITKYHLIRSNIGSLTMVQQIEQLEPSSKSEIMFLSIQDSHFRGENWSKPAGG